MINHTSNARFLTLISVGLLSITVLTACVDDSIKQTDKIPAPLAEMMLAQLKIYGGESGKQLQNRRNQLSVILGGS